MKKIILIVLGLIIVTGCSTKEVEKNKQVVETNGLLSYTIDGKLASVKPTKEDGYIVNKIICDNGSDLMWDNDNWEVELTEVKSKDRCMVDFTKDINTSGYRVMVTSNDTSSLDSLSKATTENGTVIIYSTSKLKSVSGCNGRVEGNKVIVSNVTENQTCNITIVPTLADTIKISYPPKPGRTDFTKIDNGTPGLYTGTDDQGTTYYFSGDGTNMNNWVRFAGKLWRIIRINGNGSVRLLYAGSGGEDGYIGSVQAYNTGGHPAYVGWKYTTGETLEASRGNKNKSNAYTTVENWYNELNSTDKNYIDLEAIYCNDRDIRSGSYSTSKPFYYTVYRRLAEGRNPVFTCGSTLDRFTTFGLITADEITYAGGNYGFVSPLAYYYLNANGGSSTGTNYWWTMSPFSFDTIGNTGSMVFKVNGSSGGAGILALGSTGINDGVIRPVISIKSNVIVTNGDGSANSPYELSL